VSNEHGIAAELDSANAKVATLHIAASLFMAASPSPRIARHLRSVNQHPAPENSICFNEAALKSEETRRQGFPKLG